MNVINNLITLLGSLIGTLGGIVVSMRLVNFRLEKLEKQVENLLDVHKEIAVLREYTENHIESINEKLSNMGV